MHFTLQEKFHRNMQKVGPPPHEAGTQQAAPQPEAHGPSHGGRPGFLCLSPQTSASRGELRPGYLPPHSSTTGPQHTAAPTAHPAPHSADARQRPSRARGQIPFASRTGVRAPTPKPPFPPGGQCPRARAAPPRVLAVTGHPAAVSSAAGTAVSAAPWPAAPGVHPARGPEPPTKAALRQQTGSPSVATRTETGGKAPAAPGEEPRSRRAPPRGHGSGAARTGAEPPQTRRPPSGRARRRHTGAAGPAGARGGSRDQAPYAVRARCRPQPGGGRWGRRRLPRNLLQVALRSLGPPGGAARQSRPPSPHLPPSTWPHGPGPTPAGLRGHPG